MGKKNLDKLFQEKLSDFSDAPDEKVWQSIEVSLDKKKKSRKVIPIWWKFGGVAAVMAIALYIINPFEENNVADPIITESEIQEDKTNSNTEEGKIKEGFEKSETEIVDIDKQDLLEENTISQEDTSNSTIERTTDSKEEDAKLKSPIDKTDIKIATNDVPDEKQNQEKNRNVNPSIEANSIHKSNEEAVAVVQDNTKSENSVERNVIGQTNGQDTVKQDNLSIEKETGIAQVEENDTSVKESEEAEKKSIFDEIAEQEEEKEESKRRIHQAWPPRDQQVQPGYSAAPGRNSGRSQTEHSQEETAGWRR